MKPIPADPSFVARFRATIAAPARPGGCELSTLKAGDDSYATFTWQGPDGRRWKYRAHRLALTLATPPPFDGAYALHACNTPLCCATSDGHLYWGTARDNAADRDRPYRRSQLRHQRARKLGQMALFTPTSDTSNTIGRSASLRNH